MKIISKCIIEEHHEYGKFFDEEIKDGGFIYYVPKKEYDRLEYKFKQLESWVNDACWKISEAEQILQQDYKRLR